jgi:hypothetical protein
MSLARYCLPGPADRGTPGPGLAALRLAAAAAVAPGSPEVRHGRQRPPAARAAAGEFDKLKRPAAQSRRVTGPELSGGIRGPGARAGGVGA